MGLSLVLASRSPHRRSLLERLNIDFEVRIPNIDETQQPSESPQRLVQRLSKEKARAVIDDRDEIIIGSDQLAVCNGARQPQGVL